MSSGTRKDEKVQKKTFGKWINAQLAGRGIVITDLYYDLRDGHVLLELLGVLTNRSFVKEKGKLRVHHLGNAYTILSILKENKVKLVNINNVDLVDGNPKITLALVWSIIVHWQFRDVMKESIVKGSSGLEKILLAWTCSATQKHYPDSVKDFGDSWRNGLAFGALLAHFRPDLVVWDNYLRIQNHTDRLDFIFNTIRDHLGIQKLLDPEDFLSTPDKKSLMMYIMCLYDVLPHDIVPLERGQSLNSDSECSLFGSPFKTPVKVTEEGLKYEVYCPLHEDMVQWLLDAEEKLNSMRKVHGDLPEIKQLFEEYKEYMEELNYNQEAVGEVLELGSKLIDDPNLTPFQEKDVRVRVKVLSDKWEELRVLAMNRQSKIFELLMTLQKEKMKELRGWMTLTEDRISRMGSIGINLEDIDKQMREHSVLQKDLESQQTIVNSISNFIIADIGEGKSEGHVSSSNSNEQELEDQVTALGERWIHLCVWIEDRWSALKDASKLWSSFSTEKEVLNIWLDNSMSTLKQVERSPTEDMKELMIQLRLIATIHAEVNSYQRKMSSLEKTVDFLCLRYESTSASSVPESVTKDLELLQDRWEILRDILEAQKQRISSLGINIENYLESPTVPPPSREPQQQQHEESVSKKELTTNAIISMACKSNGGVAEESPCGEDSTPKKRKITGSKRIQFETSYAKLVAWLHPRLEPSYEIKVDEDISIESEVNKTFELGKDLIRTIISEADFPPDYLENVRFKIKELEALWGYFDIKRQYSSLKSNFYKELASLKKFLDVSQKLIESCEDIECLRTGKEAFIKHSETLDSIKRLSKEVALCPGALQDPSSSVKSDLYSFCDKWELIESGFEAKEIELIKRNKLLERQLKKSHATENRLGGGSGAISSHTNGNMKTDLGFETDPNKMDKLRTIYSDVEELEAWMNQTEKSLSSNLDDGSDHGNRLLPGLIEDLTALEKKLDNMNSMGSMLMTEARDESKAKIFENYLKNTHERWTSIAENLKDKHSSYLHKMEKSRQMEESRGEILQFLKNIQRDYENLISSQSHSQLTKPQELSQRTFKLLHFKDRIEKKRQIFDELIKNTESEDPPWLELQKNWDTTTESILNRYNIMKNSSADYGEFKSLAAQESDWLERLEKKLRKSTLTTAADAEEISEALDDIENFIHNHSSAERLGRLEELTESLSQNGIKFDSVFVETNKLKDRWNDLSKRAKERTSLLEGLIVEAQEWEYKILSVQDWLSERDMLLSSHLEHELNVDDLPEETQEAILREFEDHENLLSEMDEQVEAYREEGKTEAASRLEDQLNLIHSRFRELAMKFELFQRQSASEYSLVLDRVSRELRDISSQLSLAELRSWDTTDVGSQLIDANCVYTALSGIKPEVENVIKMGRRLVAENHPSDDGNEELTCRIDALKIEFNQVGSQITESRTVLEKALKLSEKLRLSMHNVEMGLTADSIPEESNLCDSEEDLYLYLKNKVSEMIKLKDDLRSILQIKSDLISLSLHGPIDEAFINLQKRVDAIESRWKDMVNFLSKIHHELKKSHDVSNINPSALNFDKEPVTLLKEGNSPLLAEFKSAFQEVSARIDSVEAKLFKKQTQNGSGYDESKCLELGQEIESLRPEMSNLREMAIKLVVMFVGKKGDVEPEMRSLGQRWDDIVRTVEERLAQNKEFNMVEVEEIKTTISHLRIPTPSSIVSSSNNTKKNTSSSLQLFSPDSEMDSEEIVTLPEDDDEMVSSCSSSSHHIPSPSKKDETKKIISSLSIIPSSNKRGVKSLPVTSVLSTTTTTTNGSEKVKVKVCINTLPSPQKAVKSPVTINSQVPFNVPEQTYLTSNSSSSSLSTATLTESKNGGIDDLDEESSLARDNEAIEKLLNDTNNHIQELKSKSTSYHSSRYNSSSSSSSSSAGILEKESTDFANSKKNIMSKISKAKGKIMDLDREADIKLRLDLIEMESQMIEAEVATLISRGDTLVLMTHRNDISKAEALQKDVSELRESWADIRSLCERKKAQAASLEKKLEEFKESADEIKSWISSFKSTRNVRQSPVFSRKKLEVDSLNNLGSTLKRQNVLGVNALNLSLINSKWDYLLNGSTRTPSKNETALLSNKSPRQRASDSQKEIATILEKLIDAVNVISRQMNNQFLSSPRIYENLLGQRKSLETVRSAIERIGPTVRKTESDVEGLNGRDGGLSVEYYDKILVLGEKLRKSWMDLNSKYLQRHEIWKVCSRNSDTFGKDIIELNKCFDISHPSVSQAKLSEKQKEITNVTSLGKEIIGQTSSDEAIGIQIKIDDLLKKWSVFVDKYSPKIQEHIESDPPPSVPSDKVIPSIDDTLSYLQKPVNVSSLNQVSHAIEKLDTIQKSFLESKEDQDKSSSSKIEKLTPILSKKLSYLSERKSKLEKFKQKIEAAHTWVEDMSRKLSDVAKQKMKGSRSEVISRIRLAVIDKEYEVNRLLNEYMILEREVSMQQEVDPELRKSVDSFKIAWKKLTSESRRISTEGSTSRETSPMVRHNNKSSDSSSMKEGPSYGSMMSTSSETAITSTTNKSVASGTTYITSPLSEEVAPFSLTLEPSMSELDIWLDSIASEISGNVAPVHDNESVKELITRITFYLHDLEIKRPFIDDLMTNSSNLAREENQMKMKIKSLRDHWDSVKCLLLSRKTELMSMSTESDQFKRKSMEMNTGLKRIEEKLAKINRNSSVRPSSFESLDLQIKSYLTLKKDLAKFYHQFNSFSSFCRRISSVYSKDDTSKINEFEGSILSKYQELEASVNENHDSLQTSKSVLTNYDSSVQKFLAWLSEVESHVENLEENEDIRREPSKLLSKLSLLKEDISSKNPEFTSILSTGESISHGMTHTESGMLRQRGDEMSLRVKALTNKVDHLNEFLLQSKEEINSSSSPNKENFSSSSRCNGDVIPEEEEEGSLLRWIEKKRKEIRSLSMKSDLSGLKKQLEEHEAFEKRITEEKEGRSPHGLGSLKENQEWNTLKTDIEEWRTRLLERIRDLKMFQNDFESLTSRLAAVEETRSLWNEEEEEEDSLLETTDITTLAKNKDPRSKIDPHKNDDDIKNIAKQEENMKNRLNMKSNQLKRLQESLGSLEEGLVGLKKQAEMFNKNGQKLSESTRQQLQVLEERIINLRNTLPHFQFKSVIADPKTRKNDLIQNETKSEDLPPGWERGFTEDHIPYFLNHEDAKTTWDHPVFSSLMNSLKGINSVQYSVYRLSLKLRKIQQKLCLDLLDIEAALMGFNEWGLGPERHDCSINVPEMNSVLTSLISAAHVENPDDVDVPLCTNLALNWILNVYDPCRTGSVRVFAFKIAILIFTRGPLADKYKAFFELLSYPENNSLDPSRVGLLIHDSLQVPKVFGEIASFGGSNVEPSVRSCFTMDLPPDRTTPLSTVNEEHFIKWLRREPQCLVWLPVLHRLAWAELAKHNAKCNVCKMYPMIGFRYLCLKCFNFDLCHNCFFLGKTTKTHSLDHPMKEFCTSTGASVNLKNFTASVRNSFRTKKYFKKKYKQLCYLPVSSVLEGEDFVIPPISSMSQTSTLESNKSENYISVGVEKESGEDEEDDEEDVDGDTRPNGVQVNGNKNGLVGHSKSSSLKHKIDLDDEHCLISKYCQILFDNNNSPEMESSLSEDPPPPLPGTEKVIIDQIKTENKQCKRLEKRINILESHNKQLEGQVQRLRELYSNGSEGGGTLNSKSIIASDLTTSSTDIDTEQFIESIRQPPKMYFFDSREDDDEEHFRSDSPDSLNLSQHETTVISD